MDSRQIATWVAEPPPPEVQRALERLCRGEDVRRVAVMPDVHLSREVCVGVALGTDDTLIPAAVGGDIGCGMTAIAFHAQLSVLDDAASAAAVLDGLYRIVPVIRHRRSSGVELPRDLEHRRLGRPELERIKTREASLQFGTLGRGNHFLEFQADTDDRLWLMVHSGSRGIGQAIRGAYEREGRKDRAGLLGLRASSEPGKSYLGDMQWALDYAARSRERIVEQVCGLMRDLFGVHPDESTVIACHHNFVRSEEHGGSTLWVHRKGAISAREGELGIIPGSMGAASFHVQGRGCEASLCSSSHGAGRAMSRSVARRRITSRQLRDSMDGVWFDRRIAHRLLEEAPGAYKDIGAVMRAQKQLTKVVRRLRPVLAFKGG